MKSFNQIEKQYNNRKRIINAFFIINLACIIIGGLGFIVLGITLLLNPELIGEFIGRMVKGFKQIE